MTELILKDIEQDLDKQNITDLIQQAESLANIGLVKILNIIKERGVFTEDEELEVTEQVFGEVYREESFFSNDEDVKEWIDGDYIYYNQDIATHIYEDELDEAEEELYAVHNFQSVMINGRNFYGSWLQTLGADTLLVVELPDQDHPVVELSWD